MGTARRLAQALLLAVILAIVAVRCAVEVLRALDVFADYHAYYRAAAHLRAGADLYAEGKLLVARNSYAFWTQTDGQYVYPPLLAILLLPLTVLGIGKGASVWLVALVLALIGFVWVAARVLGRTVGIVSFLAVALPVAGALPVALGLRYQTLDRYLLTLALPGLLGSAALAWLCAAAPAASRFGWRTIRDDLARVAPLAVPVLGATPLLLGLRFGQADLLLLLLTTLALLVYLGGQEVWAGIALGAAAAIKPTLALYGLYFLRKRQWRTLGAAALTGAILCLAPFALLGGNAFADWLAIARYFGGGDYLAYPSNGSLRGALLRAFVGGPTNAPLVANRTLADVLWVLGVMVALLVWWRAVTPQRQEANRATAEYALTATLILFAAPLSEDIHFVAVVLPLVVLAERLWRQSSQRWWRVLALIACLVFILPIVAWGASAAQGSVAVLLASAIPLGALLLVATALLTARLMRE